MKKLLMVIPLVFLLNFTDAFHQLNDHIFDGKMKYRILGRTLVDKFSLVHGFISDEIVVCNGWPFSIGAPILVLVPKTEEESVQDTNNLIYTLMRYPFGSWQTNHGLFTLFPLPSPEKEKE